MWGTVSIVNRSRSTGCVAAGAAAEDSGGTTDAAAVDAEGEAADGAAAGGIAGVVTMVSKAALAGVGAARLDIGRANQKPTDPAAPNIAAPATHRATRRQARGRARCGGGSHAAVPVIVGCWA
ncbi:MAG TPA: hypothetical protein VGL13_16890, partial [Polyangiaceae bacterium]